MIFFDIWEKWGRHIWEKRVVGIFHLKGTCHTEAQRRCSSRNIPPGLVNSGRVGEFISVYRGGKHGRKVRVACGGGGAFGGRGPVPAPMHAMGAPEGKKGSDMWGERGLTYGKNGGVWHLERMGGSGIWREQKGLHPRPLAHAGVRRTLEGGGGGGVGGGGGGGWGGG